MATRTVRKIGDELLRKKSRVVNEIDKRTATLISDMLDTMYASDGVGLAAPQVGVLKRIAVVDIGEGYYVLINPEISKSEGEYIDEEGCLSIPGEFGEIKRAKKITVKAIDETGNKIELKAEDLLARVIQHEIDHLDGILFVDKIINKNN